MDRLCIALIAAGEDLWGVEKTRMALSEAGYRVMAVESWEALDLISRNNPALIIASLTGRRTEDLDLCKLLARRGEAPLVVISSTVEESQQLALFEAGVTDYLTHPVNPRELVARVHNILHRTQPPLRRKGAASDADSLTSEKSDPSPKNTVSRWLQGVTRRLTRHVSP